MSDIHIEHLDHTADAGLRITASTLPLLLTTCAEQMVRLCCPTAEILPRMTRPIAVAGHDLVELFINWLTEINSTMAIHHELYGSFTITSLEYEGEPPLRLCGSVGGEAYDPVRHELQGEIKAVTFHEAFIARQDDRWTCQVIFDI